MAASVSEQPPVLQSPPNFGTGVLTMADTRKMKNAGHGLVSNRLVRCLTNVEAFVLRVADIEQVTSLYARFLRSPRVQGAIRYESPYWRSLAARHIQVAWRYRSKLRNRKNSSNSMLNNSSRD